MKDYKTPDNHYFKTEITKEGEVIKMPKKVNSPDELYDVMVNIDRETDRRMPEKNSINYVVECCV